MLIKKNIPQPVTSFNESDKRILFVEKKLDEFIQLLTQTAIDRPRLTEFEEKLRAAFAQTMSQSEKIEAFEALDNHPELSRMDLLNNLDVLLSQHQLDSNLTKKHEKKNITQNIILVLTGIVIITLGFSMIILPAPPYFEMFTVYYFNDHDGITIMDLISLLIILFGIYLIVANISKKNLY